MEAAKEMKWAITGAGGQLGRELIELLNELGYQTQSWSRQDLDVTADSSLGIIVDAKPDVIVNCAAWTDVDRAELEPEKAFAVNQHGAANVAMAAKELGIPLVHISTDYVFSGETSRPWKDTDQTYPTNAYGRSKLAGEHEVLRIYPDKSYILRTAWLYGQYGSNFPKTIIKKILSTNQIIRVVNDQCGQPTSTKDLGLQIIRMVERGLPFGIYHATNSGETNWFEFSQYILGLLNEPLQRTVSTTSALYLSKTLRPHYAVLDQSKWINKGVAPMRDWKVAFDENFADLLLAVQKELRLG